MTRNAPVPECPDDIKKKLNDIANSRTEEVRLVERARILLLILDGVQVKTISLKK